MADRANIAVIIIYPTDPLGVVPGGTDTCIRDIIRWAPDDVKIRLIGVTTDPLQRPPRQWTACRLGRKEFEFYPVLAVDGLVRQMWIPLSLRFTFGLLGKSIWKGADILQFHRLEPALLFYRKPVPKVTVIHQNMQVIRDSASDIRWKYAPGMYFRLEDLVLPHFDEIRIVRRDAVKDYQARFPSRKERIGFLPTWLNPELFYIANDEERSSVREEITQNQGWPGDAILMTSVGRLDHQKDPLLALEVMSTLVRRYPRLRYLLIGEGVLRGALEAKISALGLENAVAFQGAVAQEEVARIMRGSDLMLLSSAYEGMPRCVVEALGCGLPVATTDVGEVGLLVKTGINGCIARDRSATALAEAVSECIDHLDSYRGGPCTEAVRQYSAGAVLKDLYECYRRLAEHGSAESAG